MTKAKCVHHFVIEPPNGPISEGQCKLCGLTREFRNSFNQVTYWKRTTGPVGIGHGLTKQQLDKKLGAAK